MSPLFVDTSGWGCLLDVQESFHQLAVSIYRTCLQSKRKLLTTNYVVAELVPLMTSRAKIPRADVIDFVDRLKIAAHVQIIHVDGYVPKSRMDSVVWINSISAGLFATMETPFIAGRDFNDHDTLRAPLVAVVNESMANKFFGGPQVALGKMFRQGWNEISSPIQIIGVVKDTKYRSLRAEGEAIAY